VKLGVLGGMGPASSAEFMVRLTYLTPAKTDQDHIPTVLWSDPRIPDRVTSIENNDDLPLALLIEGIKGLQLSGCDSIANLNLIITTTSLFDITQNKNDLVQITDMLGQENPYRRNTPLFYIYDDGTVEKRIIIE